MRRLSRLEYNNAVRDLFGDTTRPGDAFTAEEKVAGFNNNSVAPVTQLNNEQYLTAAEAVADRVATNVPTATGCASNADAACVAAWLGKIARRAFHGTLPAEELAALNTGYTSVSAELGAEAALKFGVISILLSPRFLYVVEFGEGTSGIVKLSPSEVAGRLALSLWRTVPDDALLAAADAGELGSPDLVAARAGAMLDDPRTIPMLTDFLGQWLNLDEPAALVKDAVAHPSFSAALGAAFREETNQFYLNLFIDPANDVGQIFTANYTYVNDALAAHYGLASPGANFTRVTMPVERAGILSHASFLSAQSHAVRPSPVLRGKIIRAKVLCDPVDPPPPDVVPALQNDDGTQTTQDAFEAHATQPGCAGCHLLMDPIGNGFSGFDAIGKYAPEPGTDTLGNVMAPLLASVHDIEGDFNGPAELGQKLAASEHVKQCYSMQSLRYVLNREEVSGDACSAAAAYQHFKDNGFRLKEAIVGLTKTSSFLYRPAVSAGAACR
jgi:hypothetical protein